MNGRVYDPHIGRFVSADPFVQAPNNTQSLNRYSYVINNPLSLNDPSGYFWGEAIAWAVGTYVVGEAARQYDIPWLATTASIVGCATGSAPNCAAARFGGTYGATHDFAAALKSGAIAGVSAYAFSEIGNYFDGVSAANVSGSAAGTFYGFGDNWLTAGQIAQQIAAHSIAGGVLAIAQGGKFGHGFVSAFVTKAMTNVQMATGDGVRGTITAAVIGGTTSELTGGKFANGAATAAFQFAFNAASLRGKKTIHEVEFEEFVPVIENGQHKTRPRVVQEGIEREGALHKALRATLDVLSFRKLPLGWGTNSPEYEVVTQEVSQEWAYTRYLVRARGIYHRFGFTITQELRRTEEGIVWKDDGHWGDYQRRFIRETSR